MSEWSISPILNAIEHPTACLGRKTNKMLGAASAHNTSDSHKSLSLRKEVLAMNQTIHLRVMSPLL